MVGLLASTIRAPHSPPSRGLTHTHSQLCAVSGSAALHSTQGARDRGPIDDPLSETVSPDPILNSPAGTTTISEQSGQSRKISPGSGIGTGAPGVALGAFGD